MTFTIYLNGSVDQSWEKPPNYWKNKHWCDVSNWAGSSQVRSIEHSHTIVKILQNVVFTSHAVMMTLNKIDEIAPSPRNFVLLTRPQGSSRPAFFTSRPLKSYSSYFIVSILMPHLNSTLLNKTGVLCMIPHFSILFCWLISWYLIPTNWNVWQLNCSLL